MNAAKIHLSAEELALVQNGAILLTKNNIIHKVYALFGALSENLRNRYEQNNSGFPEILNTYPKIAKGENFQGLPYVMLDYPRLFGKEDVLAIRTFFWWGHNFTVTLHLKGVYMEQLSKSIEANASKLQKAGFRICLSGNEWEHDLNASIWKENTLDSITEKKIREAAFCKIACSIPLQQWQHIDTILEEKHQLVDAVLGY